MKKKNYLAIMEPDQFYHFYNRAVGNELLFYNDENRKYFLELTEKYLGNFVEFYGYCLMPNHFHFLIRTKGRRELPNEKILPEMIRQMCIKYVNTVNKEQGRKGTLLMRPYKRIKIEGEKYLRDLEIYIHLNPLHHGVNQDYQNYKWSSFEAIIDLKYTKIEREKVIYLFNDVETFIYFHLQQQGFSLLDSLTIEDI